MATDNRKIQLESEVVDNTKPGFDSIKRSAAEMAAGVKQSSDQASKSVGGIGDGSDGAAAKLDRSTKSIISSVQRATAALEAGGSSSSKYFESIAAQRGISGDALKPYLDQLKQAERAQQVASGSLDRMGLSAKQTSAALRQVPAQFTDIITSLQGGQAPLTVLLQQGGQLKDVFGGVGAAASALGNYVLGLVNPFTVLAAAVGGLAVAYNLGSKEADEYRKALVLTGNATGTTVGQLQVYAQQISTVVGTQGKAAEALTAFAASGKVGSESLRQFAQTAIQFERATGTSIDETVKKFAELKNAPLEASVKLNEATNFLTDSLYKQIKALIEQGRATEAAKVAQEAFDSSLRSRSGEITQNLGTIETAWKNIGEAIKKATDKALNFGRAATPVDRLKVIDQSILEKEQSLGGLSYGNSRDAEKRKEIDVLRAERAEIIRNMEAERERAEEQRKQGELVKARAEFDKAGAKYISEKIRMERELAAAVQQGVAAGVSQADLLTRINAIRESYAKKGKSTAAAENKDLQDQTRVYAELAGVSSSYYKELDAAQKQRANGLITEGQYVAYVETLIQKQPFYVEQVKKEAEAVKQLRKAREDEANELDRVLEQRAKSADSVGQQVQRLRDEEEAAGIAAQENISLAQAIEKVGLARLREEQAKLRAQGSDEGTLYYLQKEIDAREQLIDLMGNKDAREAGVRAARDAEDAWKRTAESIENSLTDALLRGFESGKGFLRNLIDTTKNLFATLVLRPQIQAVLGLSGAGASGSALASGGGGGGSLGGLSSLSGFFGGNSGGQAAGRLITGAGSVLDSLGFDFADLSASLANNALAVSNLQGSLAGAAGALGAKLLFGGKGYSTAAGSIGATAGMYLSGGNPLVAAGVSLVASAIGSLFGNKTPYNAGGNFLARADGTGATLSDRGALSGLIQNLGKAGFEDFTKRRSTDFDTATKTLAEGLQGALSGLLKGFGQDAQDVFVGFRANGKKATGNLNIGGVASNFKTGENDPQKAFEEFTNAGARALLDALNKADVPAWAKSILDSVGDAPGLEALQGVAATIAQVQSLTEALRALPFPNLKTVSEESAIALSKLTGGLDGLNTSITQYYADFYTEAERSAETTRQLTASLAGLGVAMPASREAFRALVSAQDLSTEAGRKLYAELLKLAPAFASVAQATLSAANDLKSAELASRNAELESARRSSEAQVSARREAAEAQNTYIKSIRDVSASLFSEANRIRALLPGGAAQSFAAAQSQFATTSASARSGNVNSAKLLPGLAQQLLDLADQNARSAQELALIRAQTAASLDQTGSALNKSAGINYTPPAVLMNVPAVVARSTTDDVVAALKAVQDEIAAMRNATDRTAESTRKTANLLTQVTRDGDAMVTTT